MKSIERFYLLRYIKSPKRMLMRFSFVFMVLGIVISVSILSAGLNLFEGYERALKTVLLDSFAHIKIESGNGRFLSREQLDRIMNTLGDKPEIVSLTPNIGINLMAIDSVNTRGCVFNAYHTAEGKELHYGKFVVEGRPQVNDGEVVIGHYLAEEFGLGIGDEISLLYPQLRRVTPLGVSSDIRRFEVVGLYRSGYYEFDRSLIIGTLTDARSILFTDDPFAAVEIKLDNEHVDKAKEIASRYRLELGADLIAYPPISGDLLRIVAMQKWLIFIVFSFLVLIAGINVISAVSTMILDKKNQIAILRTLGATAATVRRVINYQILLVCLIAIIIGQALGALLSLFVVKQGFYRLKGEVYFIDKLEHHISLFNLAAVFVVASILVIICVWIPSRQINRLKIIDLIRNP
ncbi:MAG TPA: ABC transporter permease [Candidatus Cloacimonetes bacterium]|nr:ABC transporter permease [Candidatus Cloacimonadota bacterium]